MNELFNKIKNLLNKEKLILIGLFFLGIVLLLFSIRIDEEIPQHLYSFEPELRFDNPNISRILSNFLWRYDFTSKEGIVSFTIFFEETPNYIRLDIPPLIDFDKIFVKEYFCERGLDESCNEINSKLKLDSLTNPQNNPSYTTIIISNFSGSFRHHKIEVNYESNMEPNAVFDITVDNKKIGQNAYFIEFNLGRKYSCQNNCFDYYLNRGILPYVFSDDKSMKLRLDEKNQQIQPLRFRIQAIDNDQIFWKSLLEGLGISILASSIFFAVDLLLKKKK